VWRRARDFTKISLPWDPIATTPPLIWRFRLVLAQTDQTDPPGCAANNSCPFHGGNNQHHHRKPKTYFSLQRHFFSHSHIHTYTLATTTSHSFRLPLSPPLHNLIKSFAASLILGFAAYHGPRHPHTTTAHRSLKRKAPAPTTPPQRLFETPLLSRLSHPRSTAAACPDNNPSIPTATIE